MPLIPHRMLFRVAHPCRNIKNVPRDGGDSLLDLPEVCRLNNFAAMDGKENFADVRVAWNELGIGVQVEVRGKEQIPQGKQDNPLSSDGVTLCIDTRDARTSHRAGRYCHRFHLLPVGGNVDPMDPVLVQTKIPRATEDAPIAAAGAIPFQCEKRKSGYFLEAFFSSAVLNGYDPEQNRRLGIYYMIRDIELGSQFLSVGPDFPCLEDPSLWSVLVLMSPTKEGES